MAEAKYNSVINDDFLSTKIFPVGVPVTHPLDYNLAYIYNGKNNYQTSDYHRLDISCSFTKKKRKGIRILTVGVYNVYNRLNPYYLYYKYENQ
jgi:hypothetical protein